MRVNPASKSPRKPTYAAKQRRQCPPPVIQPCFLLGPLSAYRPRSTFRKNRIEIFFRIFRTKMVRSFGISKTFSFGCDFSFLSFFLFSFFFSPGSKRIHGSFPTLNYSDRAMVQRSCGFIGRGGCVMEYRKFKEENVSRLCFF